GSASPSGDARANSAAPSDQDKATAGDAKQRLTGLFSEILGVAAIGLNDDFFELGGHSLLALRLLAQIEKEFGRSISLPDLFEHPTIAGLLNYVGDEPAERPEEPPRVVIPLNEGGTGPAFFCVHSVGGEVMSFRHLARLLGPDQRFYGIQAP